MELYDPSFDSTSFYTLFLPWFFSLVAPLVMASIAFETLAAGVAITKSWWTSAA